MKSDRFNYKFTVILDIDYTKVSKETLSKYNVEDIVGKSYDAVEEILKDNDIVCE